MKLHRGCDVVPNDSGTVCRQARLGGVITAAILGGAFVGGTIFAWYVDAPKFFLVIDAVVALVVLLALQGDVRARFRDTNWVMWICPDGLWINLRSFQDRSSLDTLSVVELEDADIEEVRRRTERYSIPKSDGEVSYTLHSLEVKLRDGSTGELREAVNHCRRAPQPERVTLGFIRGSSRLTVHSVSMPADDVLRIAWQGGQGHGISPRLSRVLEILAFRLPLGEPVDNKRADWRKTSEAEVDDQILSLLCAGNRLDAIKLLKARRGMSTTQAHQFVEELAGRI